MQVQSGGADPRDAEEAAAAQTGTRGMKALSVERFEAIDKSSFQCWSSVRSWSCELQCGKTRAFALHCYGLFSRFLKAGSFLSQREW